MTDKLLIFMSTAEREKAKIGLLYATNALKNHWVEDVKVFFFGPIEKLIVEDAELQEMVATLMEYHTPIACKFVSDRDDISDSLEQLGYEVEYVGSIISDYIKQGYVPMVF